MPRLGYPAFVLLAGLLFGLFAAGRHAYAQETALSGADPKFEFPAGCEIGRDCWFFAYMDHDPSDNYRDRMCGLRTYNAHKGTDIAPVEPDAPIAVIAAADGVVLGIRDGMDDSIMRVRDETRMAAQCGNGVRLDHGNGWTSQYCHLQRGSVSVQRGARVTAGQILGWIGSSGRSELRHLHFQVERDGTPVDPFNGEAPSSPVQCDVTGVTDQALWQATERREISGYTPSSFHRAGITTGVPDRERVLSEGYPDTGAVDADALVGYVVLLGVISGATLDTLITGPDGRRIFENRRTLDQDRARLFTFTGPRRKSKTWPPGAYRVRFVLSGEGATGAFQVETKRQIVLE
ncbi:MAG: M23 family metallopeptidase [Rhodospirillaceae bacterium]|nr:M23 family metallopeptidase [Rhodospirillaceae bacterium]